MKNLEEKKLLVQMAQMLGEPVDPLLLESIEKEEQLSKIMFGEEAEPILEEVVEEKETLLIEADPFPKLDGLFQKLSQFKITQPPAPAVASEPVSEPAPPPAAPPKVPPFIENLQKSELEALKKTLNQVLQKVNTLSWGGGGTQIRVDQDTVYQIGRSALGTVSDTLTLAIAAKLANKDAVATLTWIEQR